MTKLYIIRHGNTFAPGETPRRVGGRTDIPLVESGVTQAQALGRFFKEKNILPDLVFTSNLKRTIQTAENILKELEVSIQPERTDIFNEIDYGPDENKIEEDVISRIGTAAIERWDREAVVPQEWDFNPEKCIEDWKSFADRIHNQRIEKVIFVVTSNGTARFAPYITEDYDGFKKTFDIKLKTGSYGLISYEENAWRVSEWGIRP